MPDDPDRGTDQKQSDESSEAEHWELRLYVAGRSPATDRVIKNLEAICSGELKGRYSLEVIDLLEHPQLAADHQILALPTLVRKLPKPVRKIIGDLSSRRDLLVGLDLRPWEV